MPASYPIVEIDNRQWSPYSSGRSQSQKQRDSSSPEFVSASKVASTSSHRASSSSIKSSSSKRNDGFTPPTLAPRVSQQTILADVEYDGVKRPPKRTLAHERVFPPAHEPRLRSIFDDEHDDPCEWSPTHRVARTTEAVTCHWVTSDVVFTDAKRCDKVFSTVESLAKHVLFAHCEPPSDERFRVQVPLPCNWGMCKFKRFIPDRLKEHVLEHLRPIAYACPFQQCRMSINSTIDSTEAVDTHIQTYHVLEDILRPLGTPRLLKDVFKRAPPPLPKSAPRWMLNNLPIGVPTDARRRLVDLASPEPKAPGTIQPWDQVWSELNKMEPAAIPVSPTMLATLAKDKEPPTIRIATVPPAIRRPLDPDTLGSIELEMPASDRTSDFVDLTNDDIDIYPPKPTPQYLPAVDMMSAALAKREAKAEYRHRLQKMRVEDDSGSSASIESAVVDDDDDDEANEDIAMTTTPAPPTNGLMDHSTEDSSWDPIGNAQPRKRMRIEESSDVE